MRLVLAIVLGALTAAFGAVIIGEYQLVGTTGLIAGALFGLAVAEVMVTAGGADLAPRVNIPSVAVAVFTIAGLSWAGWISAGHEWGEVPKGLWAGIGVGAVVGAYWLRSGAKRQPPAAEPAGSGGKTEPAGSGGKTEPAGSGGKTEPAGSGGKTEPSGGEAES